MADPETVPCDGIHPYDTVNINELPAITEVFGEIDIMDPPICSRRGPRIPGEWRHVAVGTHPILVAMDESATKGQLSPFRKAVATVLDLAAQGNDAFITMYPTDQVNYPALKLRGFWAYEDEPSDQEIERLRKVGENAYDVAAAGGLNLGDLDDRRAAMRASIRAIYKEIV